MTSGRALAGFGAAALLVVAMAACSSSSSGQGSTVGRSTSTGGGASAGGASAGGSSSAPAGSSVPGSGSTSASSSPGGSSPAAGGSITAAAAEALAKAGHLTTSDLPGYTESVGTDNQTDSSDAAIAQCLGTALPSYVYNDPGAEFDQGDTLEVDSTVDTVTTAAGVAADIAAFKGPKAQPCFEQELNSDLQGEGIDNPDFTFAVLPLSINGADGAFGFQVKGTFMSSGVTGELNAVELGAGVGQAEVGVSLTDAGTTLSTAEPTTAQLTALLQKSVDQVVAAYPH